MNQIILAVNNDSMELPAGIIESPQDLIQLLGVSQATAYRLMKSIKAGDNPVANGIRFEFIDEEDNDIDLYEIEEWEEGDPWRLLTTYSGSELSQAQKLDLLQFIHSHEIMGWKFHMDIDETGLEKYKDLFAMFSHILDEMKHNEDGFELMELLHYTEIDEFEIEVLPYSMIMHDDGLEFILA